MSTARASVAAATLGLLTTAISAGELTPPGPPESTAPTEARIAISQRTTPGDGSSEYIIAQPGSYYLERSLRYGVLGRKRNGILIEASEVTIDLNGFTLDGGTPFVIPLGSPQPQIVFEESLTGIRVSGSQESIVIMNGTVRDWGDDGINCLNARGVLIDRVRVVSSGDAGLRVSTDAQILNSQFISNGSYGVISAFGSCLISGCLMRDNGAGGAIDGGGSLFIDCIVRGNDGVGIAMEGQTVVQDCAVHFNAGNGIAHNSGGGVSVSGCSVGGNAGHGINLGSGSLAFDNACYGNGLDPQIEGAGIRLRGQRSTARNNTCTGNEIGIDYDANDANVVIGNTCMNNSVAEFSASTSGNQIGPIGNAATATSPWANFAD